MKSASPLAIALLFAAASPALAATTLITPTTITYTNLPNQEENGLGGSLNNETNIINGSGLSGSLDIANYTTITHASVSLSAPGNAWATVDIAPGGGDYFADGGAAPTFTIDLGSIFSVDAFVIWGYHFGGNSGNHPKTFDLEFSDNGGSSYYTSLTGLTVPNGGAANAADTIAFNPTSANFVRLTITDNYFGTHAGGDRVGIAEIRFLGTPEVPEPSALLLGGLGLIGLLRRGR
ncbi:discoidin domain-containing protein [Luteolibacter arcticus]|uniref:Discoidin domain-containing protein n=1 Tax=Luteolibacter arcticus TaxID=1581411 RepID=A0ABT3GLI6_9BACT|nr:discoidin domain-containing protein [Luteolibacter arcticus]MCW1924326.1 discoidin domain-containing protein [Luteolibacter arcticus]